MMTDTIADMLTRVRNANQVERPAVDMPATKLKAGIARVLREEGFILDYQVGKSVPDDHGHSTFTEVPESEIGAGKLTLRVYLKYGAEGEKVIRMIRRDSRPGRRVYLAKRELGRVLDGQGIRVLSTSHGVMSDRQAKSKNLGGEVLCTVW
ncbi:MAG: 30S ribosomal protein S8 [Gemmataceae bacterium]|jgi:small subunit ribosomal protein S8|nr:30S ribosomal protein S8 [Gemmataceae bacterium]